MKKLVMLSSIFIIFLTSCQKEKSVTLEKAKFQIFYGAKNLKSSADSVVNIVNNDTIVLTRDLHTLFWAEDELGAPIKLSWNITQIESDDPPYCFVQSKDLHENQIAYRPNDLGYYEFKISKHYLGETLLKFYAYVPGIPGKVGDDFNNDFIFRMEKKSYYLWSNPPAENKMFIYFRASELLDLSKAYALINGWNEISKVNLKEYPFANSGEYYYIVLDCPNHEVWAEISFYRQQDVILERSYASSWSQHGWFKFNIK